MTEVIQFSRPVAELPLPWTAFNCDQYYSGMEYAEENKNHH